MSIAQQYLHTLLPTKLFLIAALHTKFAYIVARLVVIIVLDIGRRHFSHVTKHVGSIRILILPDTAALYVKTGETVYLLLKKTEILIGQLVHEQLLGKRRIARRALYLLHTLDKIFAGYAQSLAQRGSIGLATRLTHHHHDIVCRLIVYEQPAVAVGYNASRGKLHLFQKSIGVGILLVVVTHHLQEEQPHYVYQNNRDGHTGYHKAPVFESVVFHLLLTLSNVTISNTVSTVLPPTHSIQCNQSKKWKVSSVKNARQ